jgi:phosphoribosyl-ATP pyrophosphohydrolase
MADGTETPSKWIPMTDLLALAHLGKLGEEAGELVSIISRCIIQGIDERDPDTGELNRIALGKEIADVIANGQLAIEHFGLSQNEIAERVTRKMDMKRKWHDMIRE